jgi:hypothetical protein
MENIVNDALLVGFFAKPPTSTQKYISPEPNHPAKDIYGNQTP